MVRHRALNGKQATRRGHNPVCCEMVVVVAVVAVWKRNRLMSDPLLFEWPSLVFATSLGTSSALGALNP